MVLIGSVVKFSDAAIRRQLFLVGHGCVLIGSWSGAGLKKLQRLSEVFNEIDRFQPISYDHQLAQPLSVALASGVIAAL